MNECEMIDWDAVRFLVWCTLIVAVLWVCANVRK